MVRRILAAMVLLVAVLWHVPVSSAVGQATPVAAADPTLNAEPQSTALLVKAVDDPLWVHGSDGLVHLEYDLLVTNVFPAAVTVTGVEVFTSSGTHLLTLEGDALAAATRTTFGAAPASRTIPASQAVVVLLDVVTPPDDIPTQLAHRVTYDLPADAPGRALIGSLTITWPDMLVEADAPLVIAPPLRGVGWLSLNSCCGASPHRATRVAVDGSHLLDVEAFAIDWVKLEGGAFYAEGGLRNDDHFAFGEAVYAVADGTVVAIRDGAVENTPVAQAQLPAPEADRGNQIVVHLDTGEYAFYAHLQPGSLRVKPGDRVATGDVLGLLGNSGASRVPHLHFQLADGPDALTAASLPFGIESWTLAAVVSEESTATSIVLGGPRQEQTETFPLQGTVADFTSSASVSPPVIPSPQARNLVLPSSPAT